jgi:hypothetical protein
MFKPLRYGAMAFAALSPALLLGCSAQKPRADTASNNLAVAPYPTYSLDTPVEHIAADPRGKAILDHDVPGLMASQSYILFEDMSLAQIATVSGGRLTKEKLDVVQGDLSQLSTTEKSGE